VRARDEHGGVAMFFCENRQADEERWGNGIGLQAGSYTLTMKLSA